MSGLSREKEKDFLPARLGDDHLVGEDLEASPEVPVFEDDCRLYS